MCFHDLGGTFYSGLVNFHLVLLSTPKCDLMYFYIHSEYEPTNRPEVHLRVGLDTYIDQSDSNESTSNEVKHNE